MRKISKFYNYVGSEQIKLSVINYPIGFLIKSQEDLRNWIRNTKQKPNNFGLIEATFTVDTKGYLRVADRHSEHVSCSGGEAVLSAGEIFFMSDNNRWEVIEVSNQSTGFCPEPKSWFWVSQALDWIPLAHPGKFTTNFIFRRCPKCSQLNIVKDFFICNNCHAELPDFWNCDLI